MAFVVTYFPFKAGGYDCDLKDWNIQPHDNFQKAKPNFISSHFQAGRSSTQSSAMHYWQLTPHMRRNAFRLSLPTTPPLDTAISIPWLWNTFIVFRSHNKSLQVNKLLLTYTDQSLQEKTECELGNLIMVLTNPSRFLDPDDQYLTSWLPTTCNCKDGHWMMIPWWHHSGIPEPAQEKALK